jgi:hypothetical protein
MLTMKKISIALLLLSSLTWGCSFYARSADDYQKETASLLASKSDELKTCYDELLAEKKNAGGIVVVDFTVEAKTGKILDPKIDKEKSTAPKKLRKCVVTAMEGLALDPPDQRTGVASFTYEFVANEPKQL